MLLAMRLAVKDLLLLHDLAARVGAPLAKGDANLASYGSAVAAGFGDRDMAELADYLRRAGGNLTRPLREGLPRSTARRCRRLADDELRRQHQPAARRRSAEHLDEHPSGLEAEVVVRHADRRQRWRHQVEVGHVVEADDGDVVRAVPPGVAQGLDRPEGDQVVAGNDRRDAGMLAHQHLHRPSAALPRVLIALDDWTAAAEAGGAGAVVERAGAIGTGGHVTGPGEMSDAVVPQLPEMRKRLGDTRDVVGDDSCHRRRFESAGDPDDRHVGRQQLFEQRVRPPCGGDEQAVDVALLEGGDGVGLLLVVVVGVGE